jgi:hypothetical protein
MTKTSRGARGFTVVEIAVSVAILATIFVATLAWLHRQTDALSTVSRFSFAEMRVQEALEALERELVFARGGQARAWLLADLSSGETLELLVDGNTGFPDRGDLLLARGTSFEERIEYRALGMAPPAFNVLSRGMHCTDPDSHPEGSEVLWCGLAEPIGVQSNPPAELYDGISFELGRPTYFRGDGSGFSYQVPTDVDGSGYFDGNSIVWGATLDGRELRDCWSALVFQPDSTVSEADLRLDVNRDGDRDDEFDVGRLRKRTWNSADPAMPASDVAVGPSGVIQEHCRWGADLDGDGFDDPLFLWDAGRRRLHVRLFLLVVSQSESIVRSAETVVFLRNEPQ